MGLKVFTTPSVPLTGDRNPSRKGKDVTALQGFFSKIITSFLTLKEGSTSHPDPLTLREEEETAPPRRSEPLRSKVGGPSKVSPDCTGWDRQAVAGET